MNKYSNKLVSEIFAMYTDGNLIDQIKESMQANPAVKEILDINYNPEKAFNGLPDAYPVDYRMDDSPIGLSEATLANRYNKLYIYADSTLNEKRKYELFLQEVESLHESEAEVLVFAKDHALTEIYPLLTAEVYSQL